MFFIRFIIIFLELILCFLLQNSVFTSLSFSTIVPDFFMIVVAGIAYMKGSNCGIFYGFLAGFLLDITYGNILGLYALNYLLCGFFCGFLHRFYRRDDNVTPLMLIGGSVFISQLGIYFVQFLFSRRLAFGTFFIKMLIPKVVFTILIASFAYKLFQLSIHWSIRFENHKEGKDRPKINFYD